MSPEDYVNEKAQTWECPVAAVTDRNQPEALSFLCEKDVIAVMPSLIENSSMAVYETLEQRVPFIASAVGGSPELIVEEDHGSCLVEPTAQALADQMEHALREGQIVARPRFSNDENLQVWYGFHAHVGALIEKHGRTRAVAQLTAGVDRPGSAVETVSYVALVRRGESLEDLVKAFHGDAPDSVVLGFKDASVRTEIEKARTSMAELPTNVSVVNCLGSTAGEALNRLADAQACDAMVVSDGVGVVPQLGFFEAVRTGVTCQPRSLFTTFFGTDDMTIGMPLGGDVASQAITSRAYGPEMVAIRRDTFDAIGRFEPYDARHGIVHEYVTRASEAGHDLLVFPEQLLSWPSAVEDSRDFQSDPLYSYLTAKPVIDASQLAQRKMLLASLHGSGGGMGRLDERLLRGPAGDQSDTHWLMPATWDPENAGVAQHRRLIVGLDAERDEIWLYARGPGERRLKVRGTEEAVEFMVTQGAEGSDDYVTLSRFHVPDSWEPGTSYPLTWGLYDGEEKLRNLFLRVNKIGATTFALWGRNTVLSARALSEVVDRRTKRWPQSPAADRPPPPQVDSPAAPPTDRTDEYVTEAVAAARRVVQWHGDLDPIRVVMRSRDLLQDPPEHTPLLISPRGGLLPPDDSDGWPAGGWLKGWAWDREDRGRVLHVALVRDQEPLIMVTADRVDQSLNEVPGRGQHAFQIPVLSEFLDGEWLQLDIWEGRTPVFRGGLYVDRDGEPMLRRVRDKPPATEVRGRGTVVRTEMTERLKRWWSRR